jgi:hypothetical protein
MVAYVVVGGLDYAVDTAEEIAVAKAALREVGIESAPVFVGEPDGLGDSYRNGQVLWAEPRAGAGRIVIACEGVEIGDWGGEDASDVLERFGEFVARRTGAEVELGGSRTVVECDGWDAPDVDVTLWGEFCVEPVAEGGEA